MEENTKSLLMTVAASAVGAAVGYGAVKGGTKLFGWIKDRPRTVKVAPKIEPKAVGGFVDIQPKR